MRKLITGALLLIALLGLGCDISGGNLFVGDGCEKGTSQTYAPDGSVECAEDK